MAFTLNKIKDLLERKDVVCIICDDGSTDGTSNFLKIEYPNIELIQNSESRGLIFSRNRLLNLTTTEFSISLDDDANFVSTNTLQYIIEYFYNNSDCGLIALRVFWGLKEPEETTSNEKPQHVQSFVCCAHV